jgi:hypothetical protein
MGSECSLRAASRMSGDHAFDGVKLCDVPNCGRGDRRFAIMGQFDEAPAQTAPACTNVHGPCGERLRSAGHNRHRHRIAGSVRKSASVAPCLRATSNT